MSKYKQKTNGRIKVLISLDLKTHQVLILESLRTRMVGL